MENMSILNLEDNEPQIPDEHEVPIKKHNENIESKGIILENTAENNEENSSIITGRSLFSYLLN
jgi:hypothetical protein